MAETVKIDNDSLKKFNYVKDLETFFETSDKDVAVVVNKFDQKFFGIIKEYQGIDFNGVIYKKKHHEKIAPKKPQDKVPPPKKSSWANFFGTTITEKTPLLLPQIIEENDTSTDFSSGEKQLNFVTDYKEFITNNNDDNIAVNFVELSNAHYTNFYNVSGINAILYKAATGEEKKTLTDEENFNNGKSVPLSIYNKFSDDTKSKLKITENFGKYGQPGLSGSPDFYVKLDPKKEGGKKRHSRKTKIRTKKNTRKSKLIRRRKAKSK
jgi:hypothetical protein